MQTYDTQDGKLKITTPQVQLVSMEELLAQQVATQGSIDALKASCDSQVEILNDRMTNIQTLINTATGLGIVVAPSEDTQEGDQETGS